MKKFLLPCVSTIIVFVLSYFLMSPAVKAVNPTTSPEVASRLTSLPEDGDVNYTVLCVHSDYASRPNELKIVNWFKSNISLAHIAKTTKFFLLKDNDPTFISRYKGKVEVPCILHQQTDGKVLYKVSSSNIPDTPEAVVRGFSLCLERHRCRPRPVTPHVQPPVTPDTSIVVNPIPDTVPEKQDEQGNSMPWLWMCLAALGAGILTALIQFRLRS